MMSSPPRCAARLEKAEFEAGRARVPEPASPPGSSTGSATGGQGRATSVLVARARGGDRSAFRDLYKAHARMVHAVLLAHARPDDAEDLVQEAFLAAWRGLDGLREREHFGAWLAGIARNLARRLHARRRTHEALPADLPAAAAPAHREGGGDEELDGATVLALLGRLPEAYRETLAMRLVEGLTGPEIAEATGLAPGSVRVNLTRGMKLLRETLRREGWS